MTFQIDCTQCMFATVSILTCIVCLNGGRTRTGIHLASFLIMVVSCKIFTTHR